MECKCVQANSYEEALEKLNRGEFYNPEPKADYEIRILKETGELKLSDKKGNFVIIDYNGDLASCVEEALEDLEPKELSGSIRDLLSMMSNLGYHTIQLCDCGSVPAIEFYGDDAYATVDISEEDRPEWLDAHEDYKIVDLLEKY